MAEHTASVTVNAPSDRVYKMWSHFNDYPKFMSHVREVTYYNDERSHWVADIVGHHEWDAVNENWIENRRIGWRSVDGLDNSGLVTFEPHGENNTIVTVSVSYDPPAGFIGDVAEVLGAGKRFETALQEDLNHFATMIAQAPPGSLDPMSSEYIFHDGSSAATDRTTEAQDQTMLETQPRRVNPSYTMSPSDTQHGGAQDSAGNVEATTEKIGD